MVDGNAGSYAFARVQWVDGKGGTRKVDLTGPEKWNVLKSGGLLPPLAAMSRDGWERTGVPSVADPNGMGTSEVYLFKRPLD